MFHYREKSGLEVDPVVQSNDGRWAAFEGRLGEGRADEAADNLLRLAEGSIRNAWENRPRWA